MPVFVRRYCNIIAVTLVALGGNAFSGGIESVGGGTTIKRLYTHTTHHGGVFTVVKTPSKPLELLLCIGINIVEKKKKHYTAVSNSDFMVSAVLKNKKIKLFFRIRARVEAAQPCKMNTFSSLHI